MHLLKYIELEKEIPQFTLQMHKFKCKIHVQIIIHINKDYGIKNNFLFLFLDSYFFIIELIELIMI